MKEGSHPSAIIGTVLAGLFAFAVIAGLLASQYAAQPAIGQIHFNPYALISIFSTIGTAIILLRIIIGNSHSEETGWFMLVLLGQILFSGGEAMQRLSADRSAAVFWSQLSGVGASVLGISILLFVIAYMRPIRARAAIIAPMLLIGTLVVSMFYANGNLIFDSVPSHLKLFPWGYNSSAGSAFWAALIWVIMTTIGAGLLLLRYHRKSDNPLLRKQSLLFAIAILGPGFVAMITDGILPALNISFLPPLATLFELITCFILYYGIDKYQFFKISPAVLAENVLTTMSEAVIVTKADFAIEYVNKEAEKLLGVNRAAVAQTYVHTLFTPESWGKINAFMQGQETTVSKAEGFGDIILVNKAGKKTPVRAMVSGLKEGSYQAYVFVITDITDIVNSYNQLEDDANRIRSLLEESHRLEEQLKIEKDSIEKIVELRTAQLKRAQSELQESDKLKTEFIMLGSHNLRTPITVMASSLELLKQTPDEIDRQPLITMLEQGVNRLKDFVEDMVTIVSLEAGTGIQREPATVQTLLSAVIDDAKALASTKSGIDFSADLQDQESSILANSSRLQGAFNNIISNAFKFTQAGSIELVGQRRDGSYVVTVHDTGIGIAADELPRIFTKFHRATDTLQYEYEGKGIGLYLTKLIIDEHGGSIKVESTPGAGTTFTITLPLSSSAVATTSSKPSTVDATTANSKA